MLSMALFADPSAPGDEKLVEAFRSWAGTAVAIPSDPAPFADAHHALRDVIRGVADLKGIKPLLEMSPFGVTWFYAWVLGCEALGVTADDVDLLERLDLGELLTLAGCTHTLVDEGMAKDMSGALKLAHKAVVVILRSALGANDCIASQIAKDRSPQIADNGQVISMFQAISFNYGLETMLGLLCEYAWPFGQEDDETRCELWRYMIWRAVFKLLLSQPRELPPF